MPTTTMSAALAAVAVLAGLWLPTQAGAQLSAVESLRPLMLAAIESGHGEGAYDTPESRAFFQRQFGTSAPLEYRVRRLAFLEGAPGCARLEVNARQSGVIDRNAEGRSAAPEDVAVTWQISYCADGHFPEASQ